MRNELTEERCRRKERQAWGMAGLARQDGDAADAERHTNEARKWARRLGAILNGEDPEQIS